jgi:hypothetical protein
MNQLLFPSFAALPVHLRLSPPTLPGQRPRAICRGECGGCFDAEYGFAKNLSYTRITNGSRVQYRHRACIRCEQNRRDATKKANRWLIKARDTLARHTRRYNEKHDTRLTAAQFSKRFFWVPARIAHDMKHAHENTCMYCWQPYEEMPSGLAAVTVDIRDRSGDPFYHTNVGICCNTCNTEKGRMTPEQWQGRLQYWKEVKEHDARVGGSRRVNLPLWTSDSVQGALAT